MKIVIFLRIVGGVISIFTEIEGEHLEPIGHGNGGLFAMILRAGAWGVATGDNGAAGNRADRSAGEGVIKDKPIFGESFDSRHRGSTRAINTKPFSRVVLGNDPDDIRFILFCLGYYWDEAGEEKEKSDDCHKSEGMVTSHTLFREELFLRNVIGVGSHGLVFHPKSG